MTPELDLKLVTSYPKLYKQRNLGPRQTAMCWGFPGDGWFSLINEVSQKLEEINNTQEYYVIEAA